MKVTMKVMKRLAAGLVVVSLGAATALAAVPSAEAVAGSQVIAQCDCANHLPMATVTVVVQRGGRHVAPDRFSQLIDAAECTSYLGIRACYHNPTAECYWEGGGNCA